MRRLVLLACCLLPGAPAAQTAPPPVPLEDFTRFDEFGTIKISPDGEYLAMTAGKYGRSDIVFFSLKEKKAVSVVRSLERFEIGDFYWVSPTRLIYYLAERFPGSVQPALTGELYAVDRDARNQKFLYGVRAGMDLLGGRSAGARRSLAFPFLISTLEDDPDHILIAEFAWKLGVSSARFDPDAMATITQLNVHSGRKLQLDTAPLGGATLLVDRDDRVRFAVGRNEQLKLAASWKPDAAGPWEAFELPGFREESVIPLELSADGRSVLFAGVPKGESVSALNRLDLRTRKAEKLFAFPDTDFDGAVRDFAGEEVVGVRTEGDRPQYHWLAPEHPAAQLHLALLRAFPGQNISVISATEDGKLAIVQVASDVNPGDFYLFDVQKMKASYLKAAREWIEPERMRPAEPVRLKARDGLPLRGYLTRPAGAGPHPLVVLPHGGPHGIRDSWEFDWESQLLASRGYAVLKVNFRGSGGYGIDFELAGYREWGGKMQDDLTDATRWAIDEGVADKDRICIYGTSYGGYAALMGAVREPQLYRCAIGYVGVYDLEYMWEGGDIPESPSGRVFLEKVLGSDPAALRARSPVHQAAAIGIPILLIHGTADFRADYDHATRMRDALERHGKSFEWMALKGEGHGVYDESSRREVYERILVFLDRHLKAPVRSGN